MRSFEFERPSSLAQAAKSGYGTAQGQTDAAALYLAGGTTVVDLMKLDVLRPRRLIDLSKANGGREIELSDTELRLGAFAKMSAVAKHPAVLSRYPVIAQSLQFAASAQLRNMATLGGNVLQRTRCPYYRDPSWAACNKRAPGSGCTAITSFNRNHAVLGVDESCISQYPGDFAIALIALEAQVDLLGPLGSRVIPFASLHRAPSGAPHIESTLKEGEVITAFRIPVGPWTRRSSYVKVRDRASYEFAIASAAVALELQGDTVQQVRIGLGGIAYRPWRAVEAEQALNGQPLTEANVEAAATVALRGAQTHGFNDYKPELARRTLVRALLETKTMSVSQA
ncbi:MAG TPA: xanthine dehydrogenase family protein subunit M [Steroidobacteraceae bacterium]|nr:xanthine dehydrogenase family protein subunit M [Steroidobacteraceae bacterium]